MENAGSYQMTVSSAENLTRIGIEFLSCIDVKDSSRTTYSYGLKTYFNWVLETGRDFNALTAADVIAFKEAQLRRGCTPLTVSSYVNAVHKFYRWAEGNRMYPDIAKDVSVHRDSRGFMKMHLTVEESRRLLESCLHTADRNAWRNYAMINLILHTGLRTKEVCALDVEDISFMRGRRVLSVWGKGKNSKDQVVVITDEVWKPIERYLQERGETEAEQERKLMEEMRKAGLAVSAQPRSRMLRTPLFTTNGDAKRQQGTRMKPRNVQRICKEHLRSIGLDDHRYSAHSLRHTTAVQILKNGGSVQDAQRVLRHSSPATTQIYLESIEKEERLDKAAEVLLDGLFDIDTNK